MGYLPTGTVTFLFTDIEGSTMLLQRLGDRRYAEVLEEHRRLLRNAFAERNGQEVDTQGDAFLVAFARARDALAAAVAAQRALTMHSWSDDTALRVRMGLHTGEPVSGSGEYAGLDVHRASRICSIGHGGQILLSQTTADLATPDLPPGVSLRDLGTHRLKDLRDPEHLFQVMHPDLPPDFPLLKSSSARPNNNLPVQLTSFIGREREIAEVKRLLGAARLVTLTGSGGAGKTRLALQVAADVLDDYPDGVWLAELAPLADATLVHKIVAFAMNVPEQPGREIADTLVDALRAKTVLLALDNCEHLLAACRDLAAALLRACPGVRILATSREGLGVPGETVWRVPSLSLPEDVHRLTRPEELVLYDAVRLFVDRALATNPRFAITRDNAAAVAQVCHRLDGIPLAIELAAARVKVLAVEQIAGRLDDRFRLLTGGSPVGLPRHQTLGAAIDWSYNLLSETERVLLRRLSVFAGGWTLEAAESVCPGDSVEVASILDVLTSLVDKSLVLAETQQGEARYRLLETVREYAHDRLVESGEDARVRMRHRTWYLGLAERAEGRMSGPEQTMWLERLEVEHDNLRAALGWIGGADDAETRLRLAAALDGFWEAHTHWGEGRKWLETALAGSRDIKSIARVSALWSAGWLAWRDDDNQRSTTLYEESLALARELGDQTGIAMGLFGRAVMIMQQGDFDAATALFEESLELSRRLENKGLMARALGVMGWTAGRRGDYARALALFEESLAILRTLGPKRWIAFALRATGHAVRLKGDLERAAGLYRESLALFGETGDKYVATECIEGLAFIASAQGLFERAARLFGADEAARETFGITTTPRMEPGDHERLGATTRKGLGDAAFDVAWAEGRAMTLEEAVEYALAGEPG